MQSSFKRCEQKYLITAEQQDALQKTFSQHMISDQYGEYLVQNLYYDTENWDVIRESIEKPAYKEKLRLRCYGEASGTSVFYLELKKKYKGVVYKRRIAISSQLFTSDSIRSIVSEAPSQIAKELGYYLQLNEVSEKIYISYQRVAFVGIKDYELRVTFDTDICFRLDNLGFSSPDAGQYVLPEGKMLMEVKALGGMPLWMANILSENGIFPASFSKFGVCYTDYICKHGCAEGTVRICA